jgi:hypothetical protein
MVSFGGIVTEILMYATEAIRQFEKSERLLRECNDQHKVVAKAIGAVGTAFGGIQKLAGAGNFGDDDNDLRKYLHDIKKCLMDIEKASDEIDKLKGMLAECREAQERAREELPAYAKWATEGRHDVPATGMRFFMAAKDAGQPLEFSASRNQPVDIAANLAASQLARRFSEK